MGKDDTRKQMLYHYLLGEKNGDLSGFLSPRQPVMFNLANGWMENEDLTSLTREQWPIQTQLQNQVVSFGNASLEKPSKIRILIQRLGQGPENLKVQWNVRNCTWAYFGNQKYLHRHHSPHNSQIKRFQVTHARQKEDLKEGWQTLSITYPITIASLPP